MKRLTPKLYRSINQRWDRKRSGSGKPLYSAAAQQGKLVGTDEVDYFKYVACPLCGEDRYSILHKRVRTRYSRNHWKDALLGAAVSMFGTKSAARILSLVLRRRVDLARQGYRVVQCAACAFIYRNPTYCEKTLQVAYNSGSYSSFLTGDYSRHRRELYGYFFDRIGFAKHTAGFARRRLLDIGCGFGLFLDFMRSKGWEPYGLDFASDSIAFGRKELGLKNIDVGNLREDSFEAGYFDAVSLISVAAHLDEPMAMFRKIHKVLRPGGVLLIWTVNANGFGHRAGGKGWHGYSLNHLIFFEPRSIRQALADAGFSEVKVGYDVRLFQGMCAAGTIPKEHEPFFRDEFEKNNLGDMLIVLATR